MTLKPAVSVLTKTRKELREFTAQTLGAYSQGGSIMSELGEYFGRQGMKLSVEESMWKLSKRHLTLQGLAQLPFTGQEDGEVSEDVAEAEAQHLSRKSDEELLTEAQFPCFFDLVLKSPKVADSLLLRVKSNGFDFSISRIFLDDDIKRLLSPHSVGYSPYIAGLDYTLQLKLTKYIGEELLTPELLWHLHLLSYQLSLEKKTRVLKSLDKLLLHAKA